MSNNNSILIASYLFPPLFSGAGKFAFRLASNLKEKGYNITVLTSHQKKLPYSEKIDNLKIIRYPTVNFNFKKSNLLNFFFDFFIAQIYFLFTKRNANILLLIGTGGILLVPFAKLFRKKIIYRATLHNDDDPSGLKQKGILGRINLFLLGKCDKYIAISKAIKADFEEYKINIKDIIYIPNFVNTKKYCPVSENKKTEIRKILNIEKNGKIAVTAGGVIDRKGISELVDIWKLVAEKRPDAKLIVVGPVPSLNEADYDYVKTVKEKIKCYNLEENVIFTDEVPSIEKYLNAADIFVFCSKIEGFGTVQVEAMACGLPIICYNIPGVSSDIVEHEVTGWIIKPGDSSLFAKKILDYLENPELFQSTRTNARKRASDKFSDKKIVNYYEKCYLDLEK